MIKIKQNLKATRDRKKIYVDQGRTHREFNVGDHVFLKVKANKSSLKLGNCSKLVARFCGPYEILERIGIVAYMLANPGGYWWPPTCSKFQLAHIDSFHFNMFLRNGDISL
jgi:hypothetical protein